MTLPGTPQAHYADAGKLYGQRRLAEALAAYDMALAGAPSFAQAWSDRGVVLRELGRADEAIVSLRRAVALDPGFARAFFNRATVYALDKQDYPAAVADLRQVLSLAPDLPYARGLLLHCMVHACNWRDYDRLVADLEAGIRAGADTCDPFLLQSVSSSPADLHRCAALYALRYPPAGETWRPRRHDRIRLGYVAGEFRSHATAMLMARLFELHDRSRFELYAIDTRGGDGSALRTRLEAAFDHWVDLAGTDDDTAAAKIAANEIDILINLNGYVGEDRMGIFARRPAPLAVNWLGFPGTLGAPYMDYIVADAVLIPPDETQHYTESVVWLPHSYQPNDDRREICPKRAGRAAHGLPQDGFVFCNFNSAYKFTPAMFGAWMRILAAVPGSVLWLLQANPVATANLRVAAKARGIAADRLVFAPKLPPQQHLARLPAADLCIDSFPCNGHTTSADALWAGVPLLTLRGHAFAGRVSESLLRAVGLPKLVAQDMADFEAEAIALAREQQRLAAMRETLAANRPTAPLFDSPRFTRDIEAAYQRMWQMHQQGEAPRSFAVG
jgi:predicted O-linked N-acetylglucosamine transferase (SPINDLY family)